MTSLASTGRPWCSCANRTDRAPATSSVAVGRRSASAGAQPNAPACRARKPRARSSGAKAWAVRGGTRRSNQSRTRSASSTTTRPPGVSDGRRSRSWTSFIAPRYLRFFGLAAFFAVFFFDVFFAVFFAGAAAPTSIGRPWLFSPGRTLTP